MQPEAVKALQVCIANAPPACLQFIAHRAVPASKCFLSPQDEREDIPTPDSAALMPSGCTILHRGGAMQATRGQRGFPYGDTEVEPSCALPVLADLLTVAFNAHIRILQVSSMR